MPCMLALYSIEDLDPDPEEISRLELEKQNAVREHAVDLLFRDRTLSLYILNGVVYLEVLLGPNEGVKVGKKLANFLQLPSAEFVEDEAIYEAIIELYKR